MPRFNRQKGALVIAPHVQYPTRNGSDISLERVSRYLSHHLPYVDMVASDRVSRYVGGRVESERPFANRLRRKAVAGLRVLFKRSHYFRERFNTGPVHSEIERTARGGDYGTVLASYLTSRLLIPAALAHCRTLIWTHNDEFKWFQDIAAGSKSRLTRLVAQQSERFLQEHLVDLADRAQLLHVSETDFAAYRKAIPSHSGLLVNIGTDLERPAKWVVRDSVGPVVLTFVSSLSVKMAADALVHFKNAFEPVLRANFPRRLQVRIVGSSPSPMVRRVCSEAGWELYADVDETRLVDLLATTTFTILPFSYANGIKLKLIRSLGSGIPFLSTAVCQPSTFTAPPYCRFSDAPLDWCNAIAAWDAVADQTEAHEQLYRIAEAHSWPACVEKLVADLVASDA